MSRFMDAGPCPVLLHWEGLRHWLAQALYECVAELLPCAALVQLLEAIPDSNEDFGWH